MRDDFCGAVMISVEPNGANVILQTANSGQNFPVVLVQPAKVPRVEHVAVENKLFCENFTRVNLAEKVSQTLCLAHVAAQMQI